MIQTVDLASKFSATMVRDRAGKIHSQFDSSGKSSIEFSIMVAADADRFDVELTVIEDVPYGISSQAMTKPVTRLQGVLIRDLAHRLDRVVFLNPSTWQKRFPGVSRGVSKNKTEAAKEKIEAARAHAERLGYAPPDLVAAYVAQCEADGVKVLKKHTNPLEKSMTDYTDAFLMTDWIYSLDSIEKVWSTVGCQPVFI